MNIIKSEVKILDGGDFLFSEIFEISVYFLKNFACDACFKILRKL